MRVGAINSYLYRLPPQNNKSLRSLHKEASEFVRQDALDLIGLFNLDRETNAVDTRLNEHLFVFVASNDERRQQHLFGCSAFHLWLIMPLNILRGEIVQCQCSRQCGPHTLKIRTQGIAHDDLLVARQAMLAGYLSCK